jgi:hypothetical protein
MVAWLMTFSMAHPWLFALVLCPLVATVLVTLLRMPFLCWNRYLRSRNIKTQGWPPEHLDADGDSIHPVDT